MPDPDRQPAPPQVASAVPDPRATNGAAEARTAPSSDARLAVVADIARALSANLAQETLLRLIMERVTEALHADRSTLFLVDEERDLLWSTVAQGAKHHDIQIKRGQGLAGWVAETGRSVNVKDAYLDSRFDPSSDVLLGYRTKSMLCQPVFDRDGVLIAVVQVLNRLSGWFTVEDESLLSTIMAMAAISIVNAQLNATLLHNNLALKEAQEQLAERLAEIDLLFAIEREVGATGDLNAAIDAIIQRIAVTVPSSLCQIALATPNGGLIVHRQERRQPGVQILAFPTSVGLCARAMEHRAPLEISPQLPDLRELAREEQMPFVPAGGLVVPLIVEDEMLGALAVLDRPGKHTAFSDADAKVVSLLSGQVARTLAVRQEHAQAERESRLAALGKALAGVLHDFRTPMTVASGYVQLLTREEEPAERAELATRTLAQLEALTQMTRDVLAFARGEQVLLTRRVALAEFAKEVEEMLRGIFNGSHVQWEVRLADRGMARFDGFKIARAVQNIAKNAREALVDHKDGHFAVEISGNPDELLLTFIDDGTGVPLAFQHRLFDAFATQGKAEGTGLGLAMVKQVAEAHGGTASYRDTPGGGATFELRIRRETRSIGGDRGTSTIATIQTV